MHRNRLSNDPIWRSLMLEVLAAPLQFLAEGLGLTPGLTLLVISMLVAGSFVNWQFQHHSHSHHHE